MASLVEEKSLLLLGQRVCDGEGFRGTVRYTGPVATSKSADAIWIGVEWDDSERGKNDGAVFVNDAETRYFTARSQKAASFVKPGKLDSGLTFTSALRSKFVEMDSPLEAPGGHLTQGLANTKRGATKKIELVGELKVRSRQQLPMGHVDRVTLRLARISSVGSLNFVPKELHLDRLLEVDLQCNLLGSWAAVAELIGNLPSLLSLDISGNLLGEPASDLSLGGKLEVLAANDVGLKTWSQVAALLKAAPGLKKLRVAAQPLQDENAAHLLQANALEMIDVANTNLTAKLAVRLLRACPQLLELHASENAQLTDLSGESFPQLEALGLSGVGFGDWSAVDALAGTFPGLRRLRFAENHSLTRTLGGSQARAFVIARLESVKLLNGADVSAKERIEAEKRYLRFALADTAQKAKNGEDETALLAKLHPSAVRIAKIYAASLDGSTASSNASGSKALAASLLTVRLRCVAASNVDADIWTKKVPASTKVGLLRRLAAKKFDLALETTFLYYRLDVMDAPTYLDDDDETIASFGVSDGTQVDVAEQLIQEADENETDDE